LPEERTSFVVAVGHVTGPAETLNDGHSSRAFPISVNDYVANGTVSSTIQWAISFPHTFEDNSCTLRCVYDLSTARFKTTPVPVLNSCVEVYGPCRELNPTGILRVKVDSIALNLGPNANASATSTSGSGGSGPDGQSPKRRRKFSPAPPEPSGQPEIASQFVASTSPATPPQNVARAAGSSQSIVSASQLVPPFPTAFPAGPYNPMGHYTPFVTQQPYYGQPPVFSMPPQYQGFFPPNQFAPPPSSKSSDVQSGVEQVPAVSAGAQQEQSAFLKSAADPYAYPMTQR
jgi:hypothetical protein